MKNTAFALFVCLASTTPALALTRSQGPVCQDAPVSIDELGEASFYMPGFEVTINRGWAYARALEFPLGGERKVICDVKIPTEARTPLIIRRPAWSLAGLQIIDQAYGHFSFTVSLPADPIALKLSCNTTSGVLRYQDLEGANLTLATPRPTEDCNQPRVAVHERSEPKAPARVSGAEPASNPSRGSAAI
jgi:hypothetical protein